MQASIFDALFFVSGALSKLQQWEGVDVRHPSASIEGGGGVNAKLFYLLKVSADHSFIPVSWPFTLLFDVCRMIQPSASITVFHYIS